MKKSNCILFLFLFLGLGIINYPFVSQWINRRSETKAVENYESRAKELKDENRIRIEEEARVYNQELLGGQTGVSDGFSQEEKTDARYEGLLNPGGDGIMGVIRIPRIQVSLPVYHGTSARVLENGVGHLYKSSLPVGGAGTHVVLSSHRGLPSRTLFTDLDQIKEGDLFFLDVLGEVLAYQVDEILTVTPEHTESLQIIPEKDYVTLVTCTPYGINSHRLLVRGERIDWKEELPEKKEKEESTAYGMWKWMETGFWCSIAILFAAGFFLLILPVLKKRKRRR